jgi:NAD(P)-dependent dehydrogenase (short-subunit alcohol dehydrogenase family)
MPPAPAVIVRSMTETRTHHPKTWLITGASRGFGRSFTEAALQRGDRVAATARDTAALDELAADYPETLTPLALDVTDRDAVRATVAKAEQQLGGLDVVVNNAGYGHFGAVEELTDADLRDQLETNLFGAFHVTQAALPGMRERGRGHLVQISSIGGIGAFANLGAYHASKWALEALSESLATEVARFGIHVTIVEPGGYDTDWSGSSARRSTPFAAYDPMREEAAARRSAQAPGDPRAAAQVLLEVVDAAEPPLRVLFGAHAPGIVRGIYQRRLAEWNAWDDLTQRAHAQPAAKPSS